MSSILPHWFGSPFFLSLTLFLLIYCYESDARLMGFTGFPTLLVIIVLLVAFLPCIL